ERSPRKLTASPPCSCRRSTMSSTESSAPPVTTTCAPSRQNFDAIASPIPVAPPVTIATLFSSRIAFPPYVSAVARRGRIAGASLVPWADQESRIVSRAVPRFRSSQRRYPVAQELQTDFALNTKFITRTIAMPAADLLESVYAALEADPRLELRRDEFDIRLENDVFVLEGWVPDIRARRVVPRIVRETVGEATGGPA